jgi:hypothetical protein
LQDRLTSIFREIYSRTLTRLFPGSRSSRRNYAASARRWGRRGREPVGRASGGGEGVTQSRGIKRKLEIKEHCAGGIARHSSSSPCRAILARDSLERDKSWALAAPTAGPLGSPWSRRGPSRGEGRGRVCLCQISLASLR